MANRYRLKSQYCINGHDTKTVGVTGPRRQCCACNRNNHAREYARNPGAQKARSRNQHLKSNYGLTSSDYDALYIAQGGLCAICEQAYDKLCVDHNHNTGENRSLLCHGCNKAIGLLGDSPERCNRAAQCLDNYAPILR